MGFEFYAEIQDGHQNGEKTNLAKCARRLQIPWGSKILLKLLDVTPFRDKRVFAFYAEIQDGRQ